MKNINKIALTCFALCSLAVVPSCTKVEPLEVDDAAQAEIYKRDLKRWAEEEKLHKKNQEDSAKIAQENKEINEVFLRDLRAYKKSKHTLMFGWFAYWNTESPDKTFSLVNLPDSVDFVSNWGGAWNLTPTKIAQLREIQRKGTRMTVGWIIENIGDGVGGHKEKYSSDPHTAIEQYAKEICDSIAKYGYDGIDIDYEPSYASPWKAGAHCGDWGPTGNDWSKYKPLISCSVSSNKEYENYFFTKLREYLPEDKMMNINGSIHWLSASVYDKFNYFVFQSYNNTASRWTSTAREVMSKNRNIKGDQFIYTETFQTNPGNAKNFVKNYADWALKNIDVVGGIGAFHINEDYLYGPDYKNVKQAISKLNPPFNY